MKSISVESTDGEAIVSPPAWLFLFLSLLAVLYSVLPLTFWRLPNAVEILFAVFGLYVFFRYAKGIRWSLPVKLFVAVIVIATLSWAGMVLDHPDLRAQARLWKTSWTSSCFCSWLACWLVIIVALRPT